jgi:hypothetical protein
VVLELDRAVGWGLEIGLGGGDLGGQEVRWRERGEGPVFNYRGPRKRRVESRLDG